MPQKLTDRFLAKIEPPDSGRDTYSDSLRPGLHLRVGARKASWVYEKRVKGGPKRKITLGAWPSVSLAEARKAALSIEAEASTGIDRVADERKARRAAESAKAKALTVAQVLELYRDMKLANLATGAEVARELHKALSGHLPSPIADLTRRDLQAPIDAHAAAGRKVYANRTRAYLRTFTKWAALRDYLPHDIGAALEGAGREEARDRVLSLTEVQTIYRATFEMGSLWGPMLRLLMLTGQRRGEIAGLKWSNIDLDKCQITLTGAQTKNRRAHIVHLSAPALSELRDLHGKKGETDLVFTTTGTTAVSGLSRAKARLDKILGDTVAPWRLHDLRRAMATALAEAGVAESVVDRIQNHAATSSAPSAVARVYQQADLLPQRAAALEKWAELTINDTGTVVRFREKNVG